MDQHGLFIEVHELECPKSPKTLSTLLQSLTCRRLGTRWTHWTRFPTGFPGAIRAIRVSVSDSIILYCCIETYWDTVNFVAAPWNTINIDKYRLSFLNVFLEYWLDSLCTSWQDRNGKRLPASPAVKSLQRGLCCVDAHRQCLVLFHPTQKLMSLWIHSFPVLTKIPPRKVRSQKNLTLASSRN